MIGNCPNGKMKIKGYREIIREFRHKTGLNHDVRQLQNLQRKLKRFHYVMLALATQSGVPEVPGAGYSVPNHVWARLYKVLTCIHKFAFNFLYPLQKL